MPTHGLRTRIAPEAHAASGSYCLYFKKNTSDPINSKLWLMKSVTGAKDKVVAKYRAGSGNGSRNECATNKGRLPGTGTKNGKYKIEFHRTNFDGIINGYVIKLSDKKCAKGTKRTERWDGTRDYYSNGCIKLKPSDIKDLFAKAKRYGRPKTLYVVE